MFLLLRKDGTPITIRENVGRYTDEIKTRFFDTLDQAVEYAVGNRMTVTVAKLVPVTQVTVETIHRTTVDPLLGET